MTPKFQICSESEWLEKRKQVITATEVASLFGLNPWKSINKVMQDKVENNFIENSYILIGRWLEPVVVEAVNYTLKTNFELAPDDKKIFYTFEDIPLGATPDAMNEEALLECKTTKPLNVVKWQYNPPLYYILQLYVQMMCVGKDVGYLAALSTNLSQKSPKLDLPLWIVKVKKDRWVYSHIASETLRLWKCKKEGKAYRVNHSLKRQMKLRLLNNMEFIDT